MKQQFASHAVVPKDKFISHLCSELSRKRAQLKTVQRNIADLGMLEREIQTVTQDLTNRIEKAKLACEPA